MRLFFSHKLEIEGGTIIRDMYLFLPGEKAPSYMKSHKGGGYNREDVVPEYLIYFLDSPGSDIFVRPMPGFSVGEIRTLIPR